MSNRAASLEPVLNLARRRGFFFNSAELYGGAAGLYDLGPLGTAMNANIKAAWRRRFVLSRPDVVEVDTAILTPEAVLRASGHVDSFSDPLIECGRCHVRLRADHFLEEENDEVFLIRWRDEAVKTRKIGEKRAAEEAAAALLKVKEGEGLSCPNCGERRFGEPRAFNMMFSTRLGAVEGAGTTAYLRPETAQGIFTEFKNVLDVTHRKLPFGIAQVGKAFRNEITTGNSLFRVREFEMAELEYFVEPGTDERAHAEWLDVSEAFLVHDLGLDPERLRRYEHAPEKLSHYSKRTVDFEYEYPATGWGELLGVANRTDYDLGQHQQHSGRDLRVFDEATKERTLPYVIEPSVGLGRALLAVLADAYREYPNGRDGQGSEPESVLHLRAGLAPVRLAVLPLMKKDGLAEKAKELAERIRATGDRVVAYDDTGAIGRRYRRQDEIGTPNCVTVDHRTLEDGTVTVRDRDSMAQERVRMDELS